MAAGIVYHNITTATGVTFALACWVPDTASPDVGAIPVSLPVNLSGVPLWRAEDAGHTSGDHGVPILGVRNDTPGALAGTDLDYAPLQFDPLGNARVSVPRLVKVSANFTCPNNTSHAANDNISDNSTAGSVTKLSWAIPHGAGIIRRVRVKKSDQTVATPILQVFLWDTTFTVASGDDAAFSQPLTDSIGAESVNATNAGTDDAVGWTNCDIPFIAATLYGLIKTLSTFTVGASEVFTVDLWYDPR